jgi:hypothetical protein
VFIVIVCVQGIGACASFAEFMLVFLVKSTRIDGVIVLLKKTCVEKFVSHVVMLVIMAGLFLNDPSLSTIGVYC